MTRRRRGADRARDQARKLGEALRLARAISGLARAAASERAGLARSTWERIEAGSPAVTLAALVAATDAVGLDLVCQTYAGRRPSLRDSGQLAIAQLLAAQSNPAWRVTMEETAGDHGEAIDQVFWSSTEIVAAEIERSILDWQGQFRRAALKRDWLAARHSRAVRLVLVLEDTRRNRAAMAPWEPIVTKSLPLRSRAILAAIRSGRPLGADGLCWVRRAPR